MAIPWPRVKAGDAGSADRRSTRPGTALSRRNATGVARKRTCGRIARLGGGHTRLQLGGERERRMEEDKVERSRKKGAEGRSRRSRREEKKKRRELGQKERRPGRKERWPGRKERWLGWKERRLERRERWP